METSTNLFIDGITTDMHPLTTKNNVLTDALNATLRTYNGNEMVLLNDMGNTMIQDSTTGNIMGLRDGFIPVGMKEYGGILYLASYNPITKEGELGTIPSPVINYTYYESPYICDFKDTNLTNIDIIDPSTSLRTIDIPKYLYTPLLISDNRFQVGDLFIVCLDLGELKNTTRDVFLGDNISLYKGTEIKYPLITGFSTLENGKEINNYGWFKIIPLAKVEKSSDTLVLVDIPKKRQSYFVENKPDLIVSDYWFIDVNSWDENALLDNERCQADDLYRTYPNILPGYLYIRIEPELPENFEFFINQSTNIKSPYIYVVTNPD